MLKPRHSGEHHRLRHGDGGCEGVVGEGGGVDLEEGLHLAAVIGQLLQHVVDEGVGVEGLG